MNINVSVPSFRFFSNNVRRVLTYQRRNNSNLLQTYQGLMNMSKNHQSIRMIITRTMIFRSSIFIRSGKNGRGYQCSTYTPFTQQTVSGSKVVILIRRGVRGPTMFFNMITSRLTIRLLRSSMSDVTLSFLFLCAFRSVLRITNEGKSVSRFRYLLRETLSVHFSE